MYSISLPERTKSTIPTATALANSNAPIRMPDSRSFQSNTTATGPITSIESHDTTAQRPKPPNRRITVSRCLPELAYQRTTNQ